VNLPALPPILARAGLDADALQDAIMTTALFGAVASSWQSLLFELAESRRDLLAAAPVADTNHVAWDALAEWDAVVPAIVEAVEQRVAAIREAT
jgi:hypothetical protein